MNPPPRQWIYWDHKSSETGHESTEICESNAETYESSHDHDSAKTMNLMNLPRLVMNLMNLPRPKRISWNSCHRSGKTMNLMNLPRPWFFHNQESERLRISRECESAVDHEFPETIENIESPKLMNPKAWSFHYIGVCTAFLTLNPIRTLAFLPVINVYFLLCFLNFYNFVYLM